MMQQSVTLKGYTSSKELHTCSVKLDLYIFMTEHHLMLLFLQNVCILDTQNDNWSILIGAVCWAAALWKRTASHTSSPQELCPFVFAVPLRFSLDVWNPHMEYFKKFQERLQNQRYSYLIIPLTPQFMCKYPTNHI